MVKIKQLKANPKRSDKGQWFKLATYPETVHVCPLCHLPETRRVYQQECHCWDK